MICAYLAFTGEWPSPEEALAFFSNARMLAKEVYFLLVYYSYHVGRQLTKSYQICALFQRSSKKR